MAYQPWGYLSFVRAWWSWWSALLTAAMLAALSAGIISQQAIAGQSSAFFVFFALVSAPAQEFLYRSFLLAELDSAGWGDPVTFVATSSVLLFSYASLLP